MADKGKADVLAEPAVDPALLARVREELTCPICLETAQLPVNFICLQGCSSGNSCLRSVLCVHCANDACQFTRPPAERFPERRGYMRCLICRTTEVDARRLTPSSAYLLNHSTMALMDVLGLGGTCRLCDEDCGSQLDLLRHHQRACPCAVVKCRFRACDHWHRRAEAAKHEGACPVGRGRCSQCGAWVDRDELLGHMALGCRQRVVGCAFCPFHARLPDMLEHLRTHASLIAGVPAATTRTEPALGPAAAAASAAAPEHPRAAAAAGSAASGAPAVPAATATLTTPSSAADTAWRLAPSASRAGGDPSPATGAASAAAEPAAAAVSPTAQAPATAPGPAAGASPSTPAAGPLTPGASSPTGPTGAGAGLQGAMLAAVHSSQLPPTAAMTRQPSMQELANHLNGLFLQQQQQLHLQQQQQQQHVGWPAALTPVSPVQHPPQRQTHPLPGPGPLPQPHGYGPHGPSSPGTAAWAQATLAHQAALQASQAQAQAQAQALLLQHRQSPAQPATPPRQAPPELQAQAQAQTAAVAPQIPLSDQQQPEPERASVGAWTGLPGPGQGPAATSVLQHYATALMGLPSGQDAAQQAGPTRTSQNGGLLQVAPMRTSQSGGQAQPQAPVLHSQLSAPEHGPQQAQAHAQAPQQAQPLLSPQVPQAQALLQALGQAQPQPLAPSSEQQQAIELRARELMQRAMDARRLLGTSNLGLGLGLGFGMVPGPGPGPSAVSAAWYGSWTGAQAHAGAAVPVAMPMTTAVPGLGRSSADLLAELEALRAQWQALERRGAGPGGGGGGGGGGGAGARRHEHGAQAAAHSALAAFGLGPQAHARPQAPPASMGQQQQQQGILLGGGQGQGEAGHTAIATAPTAAGSPGWPNGWLPEAAPQPAGEGAPRTAPNGATSGELSAAGGLASATVTGGAGRAAAAVEAEAERMAVTVAAIVRASAAASELRSQRHSLMAAGSPMGSASGGAAAAGSPFRHGSQAMAAVDTPRHTIRRSFSDTELVHDVITELVRVSAAPGDGGPTPRMSSNGN